MSPTVVDVFALSCLHPMGAFTHNLIAAGKGPEEDILNGIPLNYNDFIKAVKGSTNLHITYKEERCFYLFWICKFLACTSSKRVINYYLPIARCLANGTPVDLGSYVLGELYQFMFCLALSLNSPMVAAFSLYKCGFTPTSPQFPLSFIQPLSHGHMEKPICMPGILKKSPLILPASNSSVIYQERDHLKNSCLSRQKGMVLRIFINSQTKASLEEMLHGALVSIRGIWW